MVHNFVTNQTHCPVGRSLRQDKLSAWVLMLGWRGMNATDLKEGEEELLLPIVIILAFFVPEAEDWLEWKGSLAGEGSLASAQPRNSIPEVGNGDTRKISLSRGKYLFQSHRSRAYDLKASILFHKSIHVFKNSSHCFKCQNCLPVIA